MKKWYIRLDTQKQRDNELITMVKQDIYSNELNINLVNNGKPIDLTEAATIAIIAKKPDGTEVIGSCRIADVKKGLAVYVVDYQAISALGLNTFTVKIVYVNQVMTATSFIVKVIDDPFAGTDGGIESTSDYPVLTGLMQETSAMLDEAGEIRATKEMLDQFAIVRNEDNDNADIIPLDAGLLDGKDSSYYAKEAKVTELDERVTKIITTPVDGKIVAEEIIEARQGNATLKDRLAQIDSNINTDNTILNDKIDITKTTLNKRIDNIITTPAAISEQEIIDARQGNASLGANIAAFKEVYSNYLNSELGFILRELQNGTKDEIRVSGGNAEWIKRVSDEVVFNGSESWQKSSLVVNGYSSFYLTGPKLPESTINDTRYRITAFRVGSFLEWNNLVADEFIEIPSTDSVGIRISNTRLSTQDVVGFKVWLQTNQITLIYQLTSPIATQLSLDDLSPNTQQIVRLTSKVEKITNAIIALGGTII